MDGFHTVTRPPLFLTLRTKLILNTATILVVAALLLSWLFIRQQVQSVTDGLIQSGTLLAQHLAHAGRFSILLNDLQRLEPLMQEVLAVNPVTYVTVISTNGELQAGLGKEPWHQQFFSTPAGPRRFSLMGLIRHEQALSEVETPQVTAVWLKTREPALRENLEFSVGELLLIAAGGELPIFYDVTIPVPSQPLGPLQDSALQLTLDEQRADSQESRSHGALSPALIQLGLSTSHLQADLRRLLWQATAIVVSVITVSLIVAIYMSRRMTTPLHGLTRAATVLTTGGTVPTVVVDSADEIGVLTRAFNTMATTLQAREQDLRELTHTLEERIESRTQQLAVANAKLQELDRRKSFFVSTASHELRTPLTSMKVHLANLRDGVDGAITEEQRLTLSSVEAKLSDLHALIEDLLDLARIEDGQITARVDPVVLSDVIAKTIDDLHPLATERQIRIAFSFPTDLPLVSADSNKLYRIVLNLLHNAVKFATAETTVDVSVMVCPGNEIRTSIRDVGPGIAPEDLEKVFQPFYRAPLMPKDVKGSGLGLAIVKLLVELHHGRLWVESVLGQGSCFSFTLQIARDTKPPSLPATTSTYPRQPTVRF